MLELTALLLGTLYGLVIGIIPIAGATVGLISLFPFLEYFVSTDPYLGVIFISALVASSTTGDSFSAVLLGIPGASSCAATMVDGYPLAKQGRATYALSAALTTSTVNGLLWGSAVFLLLPWYARIVMILGIPELWAFLLLAFVTIIFVATRHWGRSLLALALGVFAGLVGTDANNDPRFTFGWDYLIEGISVISVASGLFAVPELLAGLKEANRATASERKDVRDHARQVWEGVRVSFREWKLALRGGAIGAVVGVLPGLGAGISDWMAYGAAKAANPREAFGDGNIKGVIGPEGSNNANKASAFIPTVLFGIPGAPFAAIVMALCMYMGFEMGTLQLAADGRFFASLSYGFILGTLATYVACMLLIKHISRITYVPYKYYFPILLAVVIWASMEYTGGWEDLAMLAIFSAVGMLCKRYKVSRPTLLIGFILADRIYNLSYQTFMIYGFDTLATRPLFLAIMCAAGLVLFLGVRSKNRLDFA
jgi:TctA family transporter